MKEAHTVVSNEDSSILLAAVDEQGNDLIGEGEGNLGWEVGVHINENEAGRGLDAEVADLSIGCYNWFHTGGDLRDIEIFDFHELVEWVICPHEEDDLPLDGGNHEDSSLGANCRQEKQERGRKMVINCHLDYREN